VITDVDIAVAELLARGEQEAPTAKQIQSILRQERDPQDYKTVRLSASGDQSEDLFDGS